MKSATFLASIALAQAPLCLAQGLRQATGGTLTGSIVPWYPEPSEEVSDCEAELITTLCDYKKPLYGTAVASSGKKMCWEYCNEHQPCSFVIFVAGNPYTGSGSCYLYPGEEFDESLGEPGCDYMSVFDKPVCAGDNATPTSGACEATNSPSAVAEICGYPTPDDDCWSTCTASSGASDCMSQCVEADSCTYAVFNPRNEMKSEYHSGTCWMYPEGKYDKSKAKTCKSDPEQFVYENPCPKPKKKASSTSSSKSASSTSGSGGDDGEGSSSRPPNSSETGAERDEVNASGDDKDESEDDDNSAMVMSVSLTGPVALGLAALVWQGIR